MSDKAKLNPDLSAEQAAAVSWLSEMRIPDSGVDSDTLMYRAGWAAAVAELSCSKRHAQGSASKAWPALAFVFAATTAACLAVIALPSESSGLPGGTSVGSSSEVAKLEPSDEKQLEMSIAVNDAAERTVPKLPTVRTRNRFFGLSSAQFVSERNAKLRELLAEAASPGHVSVFASAADWESETVTPLTPASVKSFF